MKENEYKHANAITANIEKIKHDALTSFRIGCQKNYVAFNTTIPGGAQLLKTLNYEVESGIINPESKLAFETTASTSPQRFSRPVLTDSSVVDIMNLCKPGGEFEDYHAKAFIGQSCILWDELQKLIATELSIPEKVRKKRIGCKVMYEVCLVRDCIVHSYSIVNKARIDRIRNFKALPKILGWERINEVAEGQFLQITAFMIGTLMNRINALQPEDIQITQ